MEIRFLGHAAFSLKGKNLTVIVDPYDDRVGFKFPPVTAEIVLVSHDHFDHNQTQNVGGQPRVIRAPGEYEIGGVSVIGIGSFHDDQKGSLRGKNIIFVIEIDGLRLVHLGDLGHALTSKTREEIGAVDILMVPVGGEWTIDAKAAANLVDMLEPKVILPMHYKMEGLAPELYEKLAPVEDFLSQLEIKSEKVPKLKISQSDLPQEEQIIYLLDRK